MSAPPPPEPPALATFLTASQEIMRASSSSELRARALGLVIRDDESFATAGTLRGALKGIQKRVKDEFAVVKKPLNDARDGILRMEKSVVEPLEAAIVELDTKTTTYRDGQRRLAEEKRRADEAAARKIEEDRRLLEAEAAVANGVPEAEALAVMDEPLQPVLAPPAPFVPHVPGQAYVNTWSAELVDLKALIRYVASHPELSNYLAANLPALNMAAKSQKGTLSIPGVKVVVRQTVRGRAAS